MEFGSTDAPALPPHRPLVAVFTHMALVLILASTSRPCWYSNTSTRRGLSGRACASTTGMLAAESFAGKLWVCREHP